MKVTLVRTDGPGRAAIITIGHKDYGVRDGFSWAAQRVPDADFDVELSAELDGSWPWEQMFAANPKRRIDLESLGGQSYLALGKIVSTDPVCIDCGIYIEERVIYARDARVIGEFVGFRIATLDAEG